jgi:hypothetical protein
MLSLEKKVSRLRRGGKITAGQVLDWPREQAETGEVKRGKSKRG